MHRFSRLPVDIIVCQRRAATHDASSARVPHVPLMKVLAPSYVRFSLFTHNLVRACSSCCFIVSSSRTKTDYVYTQTSVRNSVDNWTNEIRETLSWEGATDANSRLEKILRSSLSTVHNDFWNRILRPNFFGIERLHRYYVLTIRPRYTADELGKFISIFMKLLTTTKYETQQPFASWPKIIIEMIFSHAENIIQRRGICFSFRLREYISGNAIKLI